MSDCPWMQRVRQSQGCSKGVLRQQEQSGAGNDTAMSNGHQPALPCLSWAWEQLSFWGKKIFWGLGWGRWKLLLWVKWKVLLLLCSSDVIGIKTRPSKLIFLNSYPDLRTFLLRSCLYLQQSPTPKLLFIHGKIFSHIICVVSQHLPTQH